MIISFTNIYIAYIPQLLRTSQTHQIDAQTSFPKSHQGFGDMVHRFISIFFLLGTLRIFGDLHRLPT
jgi:hypothetical protein